jgi:hypothetical protein
MGRYARLSPLYIVVILLGFLGLNYLLSDQAGEEISYSSLKEKVESGDVEKLTIGANKIVAISTESARSAGAPERWTAVPVDDPALIELVEDKGIEYEG